MKRRSLVILIACSTLTGLVVSVSTAWVVAWTQGSRTPSGVIVSGKGTRHEVQVGFAVLIVPGIQRYEVRQMEPLEGAHEIRSNEPEIKLPGWVDYKADAAVTTVGYGWPLPSLKGRMFSDAGWRGSVEGWWQIGQVGNPRSRGLPLIPIWSGLLLNTLAVAVPLVLLVVGARYGVSENRRRAGRCVGCGYDLTGIPSGCPECGTVREAGPLPPDAAAT